MPEAGELVNEKYGMFTVEPVTDDYGRTNLTNG